MLLAFGAAGCVDRTLLIRSEPEGADVVLDAKYVGVTPVTVPFTYGGTHEIVVMPRYRPGDDKSYRASVVIYDSDRFLFDGPGADFVVDLLPFRFHDRQELVVPLRENASARTFDVDDVAYIEAIEMRADRLRARAREAQLGARPVGEAEPAAAPPAPESAPR